MKIIRENVCFVNFKDLIGIDLPNDFLFDKNHYEENDYVTLTEKKDIDYIKSREDIIDYDYVSSLTDDKLVEKIKRTEHDLEPYYQILKESSDKERIVLLNNNKFRDEFFKLDKVYYDLIHYKNNREEIDVDVLSFLSENSIKVKSR